ncbi:MAG: type II secretion system F family protein [Azoarcus sp.]|jgi:general secretion pathway protein F/type IV pilus assembly protein PilC|nr:type II secretion system F family protein [Azoarcus sp.]
MGSRLNYYFYRLLLSDGRTKTGFSQFWVERDFSVQLYLERQHEAIVLALRRCPTWLNGLLLFFGGLISPVINNRDLSELLRDQGVMLRSGIPLIEGLRTIHEEVRFGSNPGVRHATAVLLEDLSNGAPVNLAFSRHPDLFPEVVCNLADIGNETGKLPEMFLEASGYLNRISEIGRNARRSLIYPFFVFSAILCAAGFWLYYVIPNLAELFRQMNAKMPPLTLSVIAFSNWIADHGLLSLGLFILLFVSPFLLFRYSARARLRLFLIGHRLPISGVLLRTSGMAFFTEHLAILVRAGIDMVKSLNIMERATRDEYYRKSITRAIAVIQRGERLSIALRETNSFPPLVLRLISVGEETGTLDEQLHYLADEYRQRFNHLVETLAEVIRPAVILLAGAFFVFIISVLLLPVYDLIRQSMMIPS